MQTSTIADSGAQYTPDIRSRLIAYGAIAVFILVPALAIWGMRRMRLSEEQARSVAIEPGKVRLIFHAYTGYVLSFAEQTYDTVLSVDDAEILLKRLVRHNLTRGLLFYGGPLVPVFTYFEYRDQKRKLAAARASLPPK
ncbi:MAG TPA: hypothetical protein VMD30_01755 [Tepidisphaeraceae bacterium]|nr:hypothetical protein [Tepidisphaeraceae bacterium]